MRGICDRKRNRGEGPSFSYGSSIVGLIGNRCQSENFLPTDTVEMLLATHGPQTQTATLTRKVTKHHRGCVRQEMRPHGDHGMGKNL